MGKKNKKYSKEEEEMIEALGGIERVKRMGEGLYEFIDLHSRLVIMESLPAEEWEKSVNQAKTIAQKLMDGDVSPLSYDGVMNYHDLIKFPND